MEYRSSASLLGLPLVHIATGTSGARGYRRGVATGWVAIGDIAFGILFAFGGVALGGISVGGASLGVVSLGGLALGLLAIGGLGVGVVAMGGAAFAAYAAIGGLAVGYEYAIGGVAFAPHVVSPLSPERVPRSPIPHAPFRLSDAVVFLLIVVALLAVARAVHARRNE
jgi:hypothetical protein